MAFGPGFSGDYDTRVEALAVVRKNGDGAVYERVGGGGEMPMSDEGKTMIYYQRQFIRLASDFRLPRTVGETVVIRGVRYRISNVVNTSTALGEVAQSCHLEEDSSPLPEVR